jgi:hypothetical protein
MDKNRTAEKKQHPKDAPKISEKFHKTDAVYCERLALKGNVNRKGDKKRSLKEEGLVVCALFSSLIMAPTAQKCNLIAAHAIHQTVLLIDTPRTGIDFAL